MIRRTALLALAGLVLPAAAALAQAGAAPCSARAAASRSAPAATPPAAEVISTTPLAGVGVPRDEVPANVHVLAAPSITEYGPQPLATQLNRCLGSINFRN